MSVPDPLDEWDGANSVTVPGAVYMDPRDSSFVVHDGRGNVASRWGGDGSAFPRVITKRNRQ